jgi:hypothetical protein
MEARRPACFTFSQILQDNSSSVGDTRAAWGTRIFNGPPSISTTVIGNDTQLVPSAASVSLTVHLSASQLFLSTQLTQRQSVVQLMSAIIGLAGIIGAFATVFGIVERNGSIFIPRAYNSRPTVAPSTQATPTEAENSSASCAQVGSSGVAQIKSRATDEPQSEHMGPESITVMVPQRSPPAPYSARNRAPVTHRWLDPDGVEF